MSMPTSYAHEFVTVSPTPGNALSEIEPSEEEKKQIKERISTNLQKLYQDAEELYKNRVQQARSDEERTLMKEELKVEISRIRTLGAEEYHNQLELERQKRKWAMGQPIDEKWRDILLAEQSKILDSFKPAGPDADHSSAAGMNGIRRTRSSDTATNSSRSTIVAESPPVLLARPEIEQRKASKSREERPGARVRRESDTVLIATKEEHRHATILDDRGTPFIEPLSARDESDSPTYDVNRSPNLERSEDDRAGIRTRPGGPSSPAKHAIWWPTAADEDPSTKRNLVRRGSTASQRSIGSTSIRSLNTEPIIPERPDLNQNELLRRPEAEKGKECSRTFQIATEQQQHPNYWEELPLGGASSKPPPPNSAPVGRPPAPYSYATPSRSASIKSPARADDDDRGFYKSPRRYSSKSSFTSEPPPLPVDLPKFGLAGSSSAAIDEHLESVREWDFSSSSRSPLHGHRPIVDRPSFNDLARDDDGGRHGQDWVPGKRSRTSTRDYRDGDEWTGSLRLRERPSRNFIPTPFADDSFVTYTRQSPESTRPALSRGASFNRSVDDYEVSPGHGEVYQRPHHQPPPSSSIPINRGKTSWPSSADDCGTTTTWRGWGKLDGRPPPAEERSPYDHLHTSPSSWSAEQKSLSASYQMRHHDFGGRESSHRSIDHVPEHDEEDMRQRLLELEEAKREEAIRREEAERKMQEAVSTQKEEERKWKEKMDEFRKREDEVRKRVEEARKKEDEARRKEEEVKKREGEMRKREEELKKREEEAKRKEEEARVKEEDAAKKEEEASKREEEAKKKEQEARRKEREANKKEQEAKRKANEIRRKEQDAKRLEEEARHIEEEARRREEEAYKKEDEIERREEEALQQEEEVRKKAEDIRRREEDLSRREEELERREAESHLDDERLQRLEEEARRHQEEEERQREEEAKLREEAEAIKRREDEIARRREELAKQEEERKRREEERRRKEEEHRQRVEEERQIMEEEKKRREQEEAERRQEAERKLREEEKRRQEHEAAAVRRQQEEERRQQEHEATVKRQQEEERRQQREDEKRRQKEGKRRLQEEEVRREQERMHDEMMRREWEKRRNGSVHTMQQGAYDKQREEIQKRKGEERKQSVDTGFTTPSPPNTSSSPLSSGRPSGPQRQGSTGGSAWAPASGFAWKTASPTTSSSSSTPGSAQSSTSSVTSATSATSASSPSSTSTPTPKMRPGTTPPLSESEWARRQAEQAKEQQERFRREQEKLENQRIASEQGRTMTERDLAQMYQHHEARWRDLNAYEVLRWETFPWPMIKKPKTGEDIKESTIYAYLFTKFYPEHNKSDKDRVKEHIKRWHPDKFNTKYLPKVIEDDKERVRDGAGAVARGLNAILTKMNEPDKPSLFG